MAFIATSGAISYNLIMTDMKKGHAVYNLTYHIIMATKYRKPVLTGDVAERLKYECKRLVSEAGGRVSEIETDVDHVHILAELPPNKALSEVMNSLKGVTSRLLRDEYSQQLKKYLLGDSLWSESYYIATAGGVTIDTLKAYVQSQPTEEHKRKYEKTGKYKNLKKKKVSNSSPT